MLKILAKLATLFVGDKFQIIMNTVLGIMFLVLIPIALISGLKQSVPFLVTISLWALVAAHWSAALAAWAAKRVDDDPTK